MKYVGGKARQAPAILKAIKIHSPNQNTWVEPFLGAGWVAAKAADTFSTLILSDLDTDLIEMWGALMTNTWVPPTECSEGNYNSLKLQAPNPTSTFVSYACSFASKKWGGYARGAGRNYADESARALVKKSDNIKSTSYSIDCHSYAAVSPLLTADCVLYLDPPYAQTLEYNESGFDSERFWRWAERQATRCDVYVSEFSRPDWVEGEDVLVLDRNVTVDIGTGTKRKEFLFKLS